MSEKALMRMIVLVGWLQRLAPILLILLGILIAWILRHLKLGWS